MPRGRSAWTRLTPIEMRMETTMLLAYFNGHEMKLRRRPRCRATLSDLDDKSKVDFARRRVEWPCQAGVAAD